MVEFGFDESIAEGQCLYAIRRILGLNFPIPEIFGWCEEGEKTFIFMELIDGLTLEARWTGLSAVERYNVAQELCGI